MRTATTITVDGTLKEKALHIIQNELKSSLSAEVDKLMLQIVRKSEKKKKRRGEKDARREEGSSETTAR